MMIKAILILISVTGIVNAKKYQMNFSIGSIEPISGTCNIAQSDANGWLFTPTTENLTKAAECLGLRDTTFTSFESARPYIISGEAVYAAKVSRINGSVFFIVDAGKEYHVYKT